MAQSPNRAAGKHAAVAREIARSIRTREDAVEAAVTSADQSPWRLPHE
jgi:hypothetical protein